MKNLAGFFLSCRRGRVLAARFQKFRMAAKPTGEFAPTVALDAVCAAVRDRVRFFVGVDGLAEIVVEGSDLRFCQPMMRRDDLRDFFRQRREKGKIRMSFGGDELD